jgi:hypothetical protein
MSRAANWFVALAALALIAASLGSYFYHRRQLDSIAARHLRLVVSGSGQLQAGMPSVYNLVTTTVTGEPWTTPVEWSLATPDGRRLVDHMVTTDDQGRLTMTVPADMDLPTRSHGPAQLTVTAGRSDNPPSVTLPLPIRPARYLTRLWLDRRRYRAGETVYYRSLTVSRYSLAACPTLPVEFEILDSNAAPLPGSRLDGLTNHGVGNGSFHLDESLTAGAYALVARGLDNIFPEERLAFEVLPDAPTPAPTAATKAEAVPVSKLPPGMHVEFYPEGGRLAAGIENRVYFAARDEKGQPLEIHGSLLDSKGANVVQVDATRGGRGVFSIVPKAAETYRLTIASPAGAGPPPLLPPASADQKVAISTDRGVFAPGAPLELQLRAAKERLPLVVGAFMRGMLVGQQMLVTAPGDRTKAAVVSIPLDEQAAGVIRLIVYDYTKNPPQAIAERDVYRRPRGLTIRAADGKRPAGELALSIQGEKGRPVAAALAVTVIEAGKGKSPQAGRLRQDLLHALLWDGDLDSPATLENFDLHLAEGDTETTAALDLALGCQRPHDVGNVRDGKRSQKVEALASPVLFDNLSDLRQQYEATLSDYRAKRTYVVNALIMLSFFGGLALALLVTMLALMRIVWGSQLWLPTVVAMVCCAVVTAVSNEPSRMKPVEATAVEFAPCLPSAEAEGGRGDAAGAATKPAESKLQRLAERLNREADPEELKSDRFVVRQYVSPGGDGSGDGRAGGRPLAWYPLLVAGPDGRVTLPGLAPVAGKTLRLLIDAQSNGRLESCELPLR